MKKLIKLIKTLYNENVRHFVYKIKEHWIIYSVMALTGLYLYGMVVASFRGALYNFMTNTDGKMFTLNPIKCIWRSIHSAGVRYSFFYPHNVFAYKTELVTVHNGC